MQTATVTFTLNGAPAHTERPAQWPLIAALRQDFGLSSPRLGCGQEQCGACHVLVQGRSVASCTLPLWDVQDKAVLTLEAAHDHQAGEFQRVFDALKAAFLAEQAAQCGYCTSGLLASSAALLHDEPEPTDEQIKTALDRHLCRCGAGLRVLRAVRRAADALREVSP